MIPPKVLILHANGTNRDHDAAYAFELAGAACDIVHINQLRTEPSSFKQYQILVIPGGFSYADTLGAGKLFAIDLNLYFMDALQDFIHSGKPVIGICNGFQVLVKAGLLPDLTGQKASSKQAALTFNANGHFECRWVNLMPHSQKCLWTQGLTESITCPVAHGEGRFLLQNKEDLALLVQQDQIALRYAMPDGKIAQNTYPFNPNGSIGDIAGICNQKGNVLGLMPHPEDHVHYRQYPGWTRNLSYGLGLALFQNGVKSVQ